MENEHSQDFLSNPNLKFIKIISKTNYCGGSNFNDRFEIFKSLRNKEVYLVSPNKNEYIFCYIKPTFQLLHILDILFFLLILSIIHKYIH